MTTSPRRGLPPWSWWIVDLVPAGCIDFSFYACLFAIQQLLHAQGHSPRVLSLTVAAYSGAYVLLCPIIGAILGRRPRLSVSLGLAVMLLVKLGYSQAAALWEYQVLLCFYALSAALFWTGFQTSLGRETAPAALSGRLAIFNLGWTAGKATGFVLAGLSAERQAPREVFTWAMVLVVVTGLLFALRFVLAPPRAPAAPEDEEGGVGGGEADPPSGAWFRAGMLVNALCWGSQSAVIALIPELGERLELSEAAQGRMLAAMVVSQAAVFAALKRWRGWRFSRPWLLGPGLLVGLALLILGQAEVPGLATTATVLLGLAVALSYSSSITYALAADGHSTRPGLHEAALGSGSLLVPLIFGFVLEGRSLAPATALLAGLALSITALAFALMRRG